MAHIERLKGIQKTEARKLREQGIETVTDLWFQVGEDFFDGIIWVEKRSGLPPGRLLDLLVAQGGQEAKQVGNPWFLRHLFDLAILALILVISVGLVLNLR